MSDYIVCASDAVRLLGILSLVIINPKGICRMRIRLHYSRKLRIKGLEHLDFLDFMIIISLLLIAGI